jgi:hypothetical protein
MARSTGARSPAATSMSRHRRSSVRWTASAVGRSDVRTIASAAANASAAVAKVAQVPAVTGGRGRILKVASTITPSVPRDPI